MAGNASSYDIIGDVAVFDSGNRKPGELLSVARMIRKTHPRVKTVLARTGERHGDFRLLSFRKVIGRETETVHVEHGMRLRLDPTKAYFSPRESSERQRIASQVKPGETVLVMFAGVGPFGLAIVKRQPQTMVYQIEINPDAVGYMKQNISMNRLSHRVVPVLGDADKASKPLAGRCDRVLMPLPRESHRFLGAAIRCLRKGGMLHFYSVGRHAKGLSGRDADKELFGEAEERLSRAAKKAGRKARIVTRKRVLPYSPGSWKICIDSRID